MNRSTFFILHFFLLTFFMRSQDFSRNVKSGHHLFFRENKGQVSDQNFIARSLLQP